MSIASRLTAAVRAEWRLKRRLSVLLTSFFGVCYFGLQRLAVFPIRTFDPTPLDRAVPFDPRWIWVYQSVYLLVAVVPWTTTDARELRRYARGFLLLSTVGFLCFFLFPVAGPRPDVVPSSGMFGWVVWYDRPTNAFPSLHVGLAAYTVLFAARRGRQRSVDGGWREAIAGTVWIGAIAYAAIATKQHYVVDLMAGAGGAIIVHYWTWRDADRPDVRAHVRFVSGGSERRAS